MPSALRVEDLSVTHVGEVRSENEDTFLELPEAGVWLVADGMGGHANGRFASQAVARAVASIAVPDALVDACVEIVAAVEDANAEIHDLALESGQRMGTTFVALVLREAEFAVLWAGDSRAYLFRDGALHPLTSDHSQVQTLIDSGLLTPDEAAAHPMRHVLTRAVGAEEEIEIDAIRGHAQPNDIFLLCSDGLHGLMPEDQIAAFLARSGVRACEELVEQCLALGAPDNVTVTLVAVHEPTLLILEAGLP